MTNRIAELRPVSGKNYRHNVLVTMERRERPEHEAAFVCSVTAFRTQQKVEDAIADIAQRQAILLRILPKCSEVRYRRVKEELECFPIPVTFGETVARRTFRKEILEALRM